MTCAAAAVCVCVISKNMRGVYCVVRVYIYMCMCFMWSETNIIKVW